MPPPTQAKCGADVVLFRGVGCSAEDLIQGLIFANTEVPCRLTQAAQTPSDECPR
jgi:hypothetical protein